MSGRLDDGSIGFKQVYFLTGSGAIPSAQRKRAPPNMSMPSRMMEPSTLRWRPSPSPDVHVAEGATAAAIGDLLGDGHNNLVVLTADQLHAYDLDTGVELWSYAVFGANDLVLAQLDDHPTSRSSSIMPGTHVGWSDPGIDWQYIDGFEYPLAAGQLLGDSTTQFIAVISYSQFPCSRLPSSP